MEEIDRPNISLGYFNEEGERISKIPPTVSKKGLLNSSVRETKYTGESEASRKRYAAELSTLLVSMFTSSILFIVELSTLIVSMSNSSILFIVELSTSLIQFLIFLTPFI
jgi:hypothetical protein